MDLLMEESVDLQYVGKKLKSARYWEIDKKNSGTYPEKIDSCSKSTKEICGSNQEDYRF